MKHKKERFHRKASKPKPEQSVKQEKNDKSSQNNSDYDSSDEINEIDDGDEDDEDNEIDDDDEEESLGVDEEQTDKKKIENSSSNFKFQSTQMNNLTLNINLDMNKNISNQYATTLNETKQSQQPTSQLLLYQFETQRPLPSSSSHNAYFSSPQFDKSSNINGNNVPPVKLLVQNNYKFIDQNQSHYQQGSFGCEKVSEILPSAPNNTSLQNNQTFFNYTNQNLINAEYDKFQAGAKYNQCYQQLPQQTFIHENNHVYSNTPTAKSASYQDTYQKNSFGTAGYYGYDNSNYYPYSLPSSDANLISHVHYSNQFDSNQYYQNGTNYDPSFSNQVNSNNNPKYLNISQQKI